MISVHFAEHVEIAHEHGREEARGLGVFGVGEEGGGLIDRVKGEDELDSGVRSGRLDCDWEVRIESGRKGLDAVEDIHPALSLSCFCLSLLEISSLHLALEFAHVESVLVSENTQPKRSIGYDVLEYCPGTGKVPCARQTEIVA